jgi:hypothetical protein
MLSGLAMSLVSPYLLKQTWDTVAYNQAKPFPHAVFDNFFNPNKLLEIAHAFPQPTEGQWWKYDNALERKFAKNQELPPIIKEFIFELQGGIFLQFLEQLTGIERLQPDHSLNGGGLHSISRGGKLDIHADYNYHPVTKLDRRLNVLIYLNNGWLPAWKGNLELWDKDMTACQKSIMPLFNRMVIFNVTDDSLHGHPDPLECPENRTRNSIALYYYTDGRPEHERSAPHSTIFKRRPTDPIEPEIEALREKRAIKRI